MPCDGASLRRTLRGMTDSNTWKWLFTSSATWWARLFRGSNIVRTIPSSSRRAFIPPRTRSIVAISAVSPSSA